MNNALEIRAEKIWLVCLKEYCKETFLKFSFLLV